MKCSQCGSTALAKTTLPFSVSGDATLLLEKSVAVYLCLDCGHYEFFSTEDLEKYKKIHIEIKNVSDEVKSVLDKVENIGKSSFVKELKNLQDRIKNLSVFSLDRNELFDIKARLIDVKGRMNS